MKFKIKPKNKKSYHIGATNIWVSEIKRNHLHKINANVNIKHSPLSCSCTNFIITDNYTDAVKFYNKIKIATIKYNCGVRPSIIEFDMLYKFVTGKGLIRRRFQHCIHYSI